MVNSWSFNGVMNLVKFTSAVMGVGITNAYPPFTVSFEVENSRFSQFSVSEKSVNLFL